MREIWLILALQEAGLSRARQALVGAGASTRAAARRRRRRFPGQRRARSTPKC